MLLDLDHLAGGVHRDDVGLQPRRQPGLEGQPADLPELQGDRALLVGGQRAPPATVGERLLDVGVHELPAHPLEGRGRVPVHDVDRGRAVVAEQGRPLVGALPAADHHHARPGEGVEVDQVAGVRPPVLGHALVPARAGRRSAGCRAPPAPSRRRSSCRRRGWRRSPVGPPPRRDAPGCRRSAGRRRSPSARGTSRCGRGTPRSAPGRGRGGRVPGPRSRPRRCARPRRRGASRGRSAGTCRSASARARSSSARPRPSCRCRCRGPTRPRSRRTGPRR